MFKMIQKDYFIMYLLYNNYLQHISSFKLEENILSMVRATVSTHDLNDSYLGQHNLD